MCGYCARWPLFLKKGKRLWAGTQEQPGERTPDLQNKGLKILCSKPLFLCITCGFCRCKYQVRLSATCTHLSSSPNHFKGISCTKKFARLWCVNLPSIQSFLRVTDTQLCYTTQGSGRDPASAQEKASTRAGVPELDIRSALQVWVGQLRLSAQLLKVFLLSDCKEEFSAVMKDSWT